MTNPLKNAVKTIVRVANPDKIILFGSRSGGKQKAASDYDLLVIKKNLRNQRRLVHDIVELLNEAKRLGWKVDLSVDDAVFLNSIYRGRYPTEEGLLPHGEPTKEDAEMATTSAEVFMKNIRKVLK